MWSDPFRHTRCLRSRACRGGRRGGCSDGASRSTASAREPDGEAAEVGAAQRGGAADGGGQHRLLDRHVQVAHGERDAERHRRRVAAARVAVRGERDGGAGVDHPAGVGVRLAGREVGGRAGTWPRWSQPASASMSASVRYVQWSAEAHPSSTASCTPGRDPSWLACRRVPSPRSAAAVEDRAALVGVERADLAERVDPARDAARGVEHRRCTPGRRSRRCGPSNSAGTTWAPSNVVSSVTRGGDARADAPRRATVRP